MLIRERRLVMLDEREKLMGFCATGDLVCQTATEFGEDGKSSPYPRETPNRLPMRPLSRTVSGGYLLAL
jgi:hypothetical protein